jgi:hypothetical protein
MKQGGKENLSHIHDMNAKTRRPEYIRLRLKLVSVQYLSPGAIYPMDPFKLAKLVELARPSNELAHINFANPKSLTCAVILRSKRTLLGFRSQWITGDAHWLWR